MKFQYIFLTLFGVAAVVAVIVFAKMPSKADPKIAGAQGTVTIWGTFSGSGGLDKMINTFNQDYKDTFSVNYAYHDPKTFDRDIVEALASGKGPDILLLPDDLILRHTDKIELIPYSATSGVTPGWFQGTFIQAAEIYLRDQGIAALPFAIDPMVMYWNRDLFNNASITETPKHWDELLTLAPKLTLRDPKTGDIIQSAVSFGEYVNVDNAKDIIAMLFLQVGVHIVNMESGHLVVDLITRRTNEVVVNQDVASAFRFFMDFSNPLKNIYSWNRALPKSRDNFINGNLAMYFGYASEYKLLQAKNPHLNFAVAPVPLPRGAKVDITFAHMHGLAVMKSSRNKGTAFVAVQRLLDPKSSGEFAEVFNLPPVRRDLLNKRPTDAALSVFYDSAIRARTWLDPRPEETNTAFQNIVESVSSGRNPVSEAIDSLSNKLSALLQYYQ